MIEDEVHHGETWMGYCSLSEMKLMGKNFDGRLGRGTIEMGNTIIYKRTIAVSAAEEIQSN